MQVKSDCHKINFKLDSYLEPLSARLFCNAAYGMKQWNIEMKSKKLDNFCIKKIIFSLADYKFSDTKKF